MRIIFLIPPYYYLLCVLFEFLPVYIDWNGSNIWIEMRSLGEKNCFSRGCGEFFHRLGISLLATEDVRQESSLLSLIISNHTLRPNSGFTHDQVGMYGFEGASELLNFGEFELSNSAKELLLLNFKCLIIQYVKDQGFGARIRLRTAYVKHSRHIN